MDKKIGEERNVENKNKKGKERVIKEPNKGTRRLAKKKEPCYTFNLIIVQLLYLFHFTYLFTSVSGVSSPEKCAELTRLESLEEWAKCNIINRRYLE